MKILLTGDDGFNSIGIRMLIQILKKDHDLVIAGTKVQQSGVGGKITLGAKEIAWDEATVDGIKAVYVEGTPTDAMEFSQAYFLGEKFDLVISGINMGVNIGPSLFSSGTFGALYHAMGLGLADKGIAMSWNLPPEFWLKKHDHKAETLKDYEGFPIQNAEEALMETLHQNLWGKRIVNINLPNRASKGMKQTHQSEDLLKIWSYPVEIDKENRIYKYQNKLYADKMENDLATDVGAVHEGYTSITPMVFAWG